MIHEERWRWRGVASLIGGIGGLLLAPVLVAVKYQTGWAIIPEPAWVGAFERALAPLFSFAAPPDLWTVYGMGYTASLLLMLPGVLFLMTYLRRQAKRGVRVAAWVFVLGYGMVIVGDAVHSLTWHQNGLSVPTPGTNPVANTAYAVHMMGMNLIMLSSLVLGVLAIRGRLVVPWLAWGIALLFPSALLASISLLPTTPSGALWLFSILMAVLGYSLASGKQWHAAEDRRATHAT